MNISPNVITILIDDTKSVRVIYGTPPTKLPDSYQTAPGAPTNVIATLLESTPRAPVANFTAAVLASAPRAPTDVTVLKFSPAAVLVSFATPTNDGGSTITSYTVTSAPDNITATGTASPILVTGVTTGTSYTFTARATNAIGSSPESIASNAFVVDNVTDVPLQLFSTTQYSLYQDVVTDINLQLFSTKEYSLYQDIVTDVSIELAGGIVSDTFKGRNNNVALATLSQGGLTLRQTTPVTIPLATLSQGGLTLRQMTPVTIPLAVRGV